MANWLDKAKTKFSITMGDGVIYYPLSMNANKSDEFNVSEFNFRNLNGTLVERRRPMGTSYDLTLIFQGGDHLDKARDFQTSSYVRGPWTIKHPYYGTLKVQPISPVYYDNGNNKQGTTRISVTVRETLTGRAVLNLDILDTASLITTAQATTVQAMAAFVIVDVSLPTVKDVSLMQRLLAGAQNAYKTISAGANSITNAYNQANGYINHAIADMQSAINAVQYYLALPAIIADTVAHRIFYLNNVLTGMLAEVENLSLPNLKTIWYAEAGTVISAICLASISNIGAADYQYASQVNSVILQLTSTYNNYLAALDTLQTATGNEPDSWAADATSIIELDNLVFLTLFTLYGYQANSKQPRYITLTRESNVILIAWQCYGLLSDDSTIDKIIADNKIGCSELVQVVKGRQILYYV